MNINNYIYSKILIGQIIQHIKQRNKILGFQTIEISENNSYFINIRQVQQSNSLIDLNEKIQLSEIQLNNLEAQIIKKQFECYIDKSIQNEWKLDKTIEDIAGLY